MYPNYFYEIDVYFQFSTFSATPTASHFPPSTGHSSFTPISKTPPLLKQTQPFPIQSLPTPKLTHQLLTQATPLSRTSRKLRTQTPLLNRIPPQAPPTIAVCMLLRSPPPIAAVPRTRDAFWRNICGHVNPR